MLLGRQPNICWAHDNARVVLSEATNNSPNERATLTCQMLKYFEALMVVIAINELIIFQISFEKCIRRSRVSGFN